jgi:hypothetical protein
MKLLILLVIAYCMIGVTWTLYVAVMQLKKHFKAMHIVAKAFAVPVVVLGVAFDFVLNVTVGSVIFLDPPREWLLTARLKRYHGNAASGWRGKTAEWICTNLLDQFDPDGDHC